MRQEEDAMIFGEPPIGTVELAAFVIVQIEKRAAESMAAGMPELKKLAESREAWSRAVLNDLAELGKNSKFRVSPDPATGQGEYMHDLIWRLQLPRSDIVLAVESGWSYIDDVLDGLEKLMHIKSPLKLMISGLSKHGGPTNNIARLLGRIQDEHLRTFEQHVCGETYLLVNFIDLTANAECYQFVADQDGKEVRALFNRLVLAKGDTP